MSAITPEDLREEARKHQEIAMRLCRAADSLAELSSPSAMETEGVSSSSSSSEDTLINRTRIEVVEEVLREAKRPLNRSEIQIGTAQRGFPIRGETLASYLSRDKRFYQSGKRGYWGLAERMGKYEEEK